MNNKELISNVSMQMNISKAETQQLMNCFIECCINSLKDNNTVGFQSFGTFEVVKREERISVHPVTKERLLVPPKQVLTFRQSAVLKEKINTKL